MAKVNKINLLSALAITALIFFSRFYLNGTLTKSKLGELQELQDSLAVESASIEAQYDLALQNPCSLAGLVDLNNQLNSFGDKLTYLESISSPNDLNVDNLYNYYTVLEVKHFLFINEVNQKCDEKYPTILFFYKNDCPSCKMQGLTLTALKQSSPDVMIYSFNSHSDSKVVSTLKQMYDVSTAPSLVLNGEKVEGLQSREQISEELNPQTN